jgi:glycine cleavage system H protein
MERVCLDDYRDYSSFDSPPSAAFHNAAAPVPYRTGVLAMNVPANLKYAASHEWVRTETDGTLTLGITDHAQEALGDLVFIELPAVGRVLKAGEACAVVESVKAASDVYAPVAGVVLAINDEVVASPEMVNADAYANWFYKLKPANPADVGKLLDAAAYTGTIKDA